MKKIFLVVERRGDWEDSWENILASFTSNELAKVFADKTRKKHSYPESISEETWEEILYAIDDYEEETQEDLGGTVNAAHKLFPQYNLEDLEKACNVYDDYDDWKGVKIREVDLIETESDLNTINGNYN